MTRGIKRNGSFNSAVLIAAVLFGLTASGCGSGDKGSAGGGDNGGDDFCAQLEAASEEDTMTIGDDPAEAAAAAEELRELASSAPEAVAGALGTFADLMDEMAELDGSDEGDMEDFGRVMALMFDPEIIEAAKTLEKYAVSECGFDPEEASERFGNSTGDSPGSEDSGEFEFEPSDPDDGGSTDDIRTSGEISLEDLDDVKSSHSGEAWSEKIVSSGISGDRSIELYGVGPDDQYIEREPLTVDESVAACEAMRDAFSSEQPELEVRVGNGDTVLAQGSASEACAPV
jgi:hypothetical protein